MKPGDRILPALDEKDVAESKADLPYLLRERHAVPEEPDRGRSVAAAKVDLLEGASDQVGVGEDHDLGQLHVVRSEVGGGRVQIGADLDSSSLLDPGDLLRPPLHDQQVAVAKDHVG
jgi:hypothetical protein